MVLSQMHDLHRGGRAPIPDKAPGRERMLCASRAIPDSCGHPKARLPPLEVREKKLGLRKGSCELHPCQAVRLPVEQVKHLAPRQRLDIHPLAVAIGWSVATQRGARPMQCGDVHSQGDTRQALGRQKSPGVQRLLVDCV